MACRLRWIVNPRATYFHLADAVRRRLPAIANAPAKCAAEAVEAIEVCLLNAGLDSEEFWQAAIPLAATDVENRRLVDEALAAARRPVQTGDALPDRLAGLIDSLDDRLRHAWPPLDEELRLRERPLREQWEARGPGMLRRLSELTGGALVVPEAEVALVQPCLGGGGEAHPSHRFIRLEAVLANPWAMLPEAARLGWLLAQLAPLPAPTDALPARRRRALAALATLPLALEAAEYVEWTCANEGTLRQAFDAWRPPLPHNVPPDRAAAALEDWRRNCNRRRLLWSDALRDLNQGLTA